MNFKKFDLSLLGSSGHVCALLGLDNRWLVRDIMYHNRNISDVMIMSGISDSHSHHVHIHKKYDTAKTQDFLNRCRSITASVENRIGPALSMYIMDYDDIPKTSQDMDTISELFYNSRHFRLLSILCIQKSNGILPQHRVNIDYVFINEDDIDKRKMIYERYEAVFSSFDSFNKALNFCTKDSGCMVIHNTRSCDKLEDIVFWYDAKNPGEFQMGETIE